MIPARHAIRRIAAALAGAASLGLFVAPAWSACTSSATRTLHADDGVVFDTATRLSWKRCSVGQHFDDGRCHGNAEKLDWDGARKAADAEGRGWRLPTQAELKSLLDSNCTAPAINSAAFPESAAAWYWSATPDGDKGAWFVDFEQGGGAGSTLRTSAAAVRLVRAGDTEDHASGDR